MASDLYMAVTSEWLTIALLANIVFVVLDAMVALDQLNSARL